MDEKINLIEKKGETIFLFMNKVWDEIPARQMFLLLKYNIFDEVKEMIIFYL